MECDFLAKDEITLFSPIKHCCLSPRHLSCSLWHPEARALTSELRNFPVPIRSASVYTKLGTKFSSGDTVSPYPSIKPGWWQSTKWYLLFLSPSAQVHADIQAISLQLAHPAMANYPMTVFLYSLGIHPPSICIHRKKNVWPKVHSTKEKGNSDKHLK